MKKIRNCYVIPGSVRGGDKVTKLTVLEGAVDLDKFTCLTDLHIVESPYFEYKKAPQNISSIKNLTLHSKCITALTDLLVNEQNYPWSNLCTLTCTRHGLVRIDNCFEQVTSLQQLNLSNNSIIRVTNLEPCLYLTHLDLSFNSIESMDGTARMLPNLRTLILAHNNISTTQGMDFFNCLEKLDLSYNSLKNWKDVKRLRELPFLDCLSLYGNKGLTNYEQYRDYACGFFENKKTVRANVYSKKRIWSSHSYLTAFFLLY